LYGGTASRQRRLGVTTTDVAPSRYRRRGIARHCMANENPVKFLPRNAVHPLY